MRDDTKLYYQPTMFQNSLMMGEVFVGLSDHPIYQPPSGFSLIVMITAQWFITKKLIFHSAFSVYPLCNSRLIKLSVKPYL